MGIWGKLATLISIKNSQLWRMPHCLFFSMMTPNRMLTIFWHQFSTQFSMLFHMVPCVLLSMAAQISTFWLVEIPQQPIRISQFTGFLSYHGEKKERYHVKEHKKLCWKLMSKMSLHFVGGHHSEKQTVPHPPTLFHNLKQPCFQRQPWLSLSFFSVGMPHQAVTRRHLKILVWKGKRSS